MDSTDPHYFDKTLIRKVCKDCNIPYEWFLAYLKKNGLDLCEQKVEASGRDGEIAMVSRARADICDCCRCFVWEHYNESCETCSRPIKQCWPCSLGGEYTCWKCEEKEEAKKRKREKEESETPKKKTKTK